jgi:hypothetical protein
MFPRMSLPLMILSTLECQNSATIITLSVKYCGLVEPAWLASAEFRMYFANILEEPRVHLEGAGRPRRRSWLVGMRFMPNSVALPR